MKRMLKTFAVLIVAVIALFSFSIVASATEVSNTQDGLVASISSEKDSYKANEDIELTFKVTNINDFAVENVSLEAIIPEGLKIKGENDTNVDIVSLASGETLELALTVVKESSVIVVPIETTSTENTTETSATEVAEIETVKPTSAKANSSTSNSNSKTTNSSTVKTGRGMSYVLVALICLVCAVVVFISFRFKKKAVKYLSLVLCVCISLSSVVLVSAENTWAQKTVAEESNTSTSFEVSKNITVDCNDYTFVATIKYQLSDLELYSNTDYVFTTEDDKYYVSFYCEPKNTFSKLELYCIDTDTVLCELQDNGNSKNGDTTAEDGVYSAKIEISSSKEKILSYQALMSVSSSKISSNIIEIEVIDDYSDEDYEKIETVDNAISELLESDEYIKLDFEGKVKKVRSFLDSLATDSLIKYYSICYDEVSHTFGFQYFNGDLGGIKVEDDTLENMTDEPIWKPLDGKKSESSEVVALSSVESNNQSDCVIMYDWYEDQELIEQYYREYEENWTDMGLNTTAYIHPTVNDYANNLSDKDVIIFATHGGQYSLYTAFLSKTTYSAICTLENVSKGKDELYKADINQHNVVKMGGEYWILPSFFSYHYGSNGLEDSIILMDNCYGFGGGKTLDDYTLSFELTNSGAQSVVGFHESVNIFWTYDINDDGVYDKIQKGYGPLFIENIVNNLLDGNTIGYSYDDSIAKFGNNCYEYMMRYNMSQYLEPEDLEEDKNVYPLIAGNTDFKLLCVMSEDGSVSGTVVSSENDTSLSNVRVDVYSKSDSGTQFVDTTYTDDNGNFSMALQSGSYELRFNKDGYKTTSMTITISKNVMTVLKEPVVMEKERNGYSVVDLGSEHSAAITENGDLYMWGNNSYGQLGDGTTITRDKPTKIMENVKSISLGHWHSAVITESGDLYMWGDNNFGQLGDGTNTNRNSPTLIMSDVKTVSLGYWHSSAITEDGDLYTWGRNTNGQLGNKSTTDSSIPVKIMSNVADVSLGGFHSSAITNSGELYTWGDNMQGQLGLGTEVDSNIPVKIMDNARSVSCSYQLTAVVDINDNLYMCGLDVSGWGLLHADTIEDSTVLSKVLTNIEMVSLGEYHGAALSKNNIVYTWGMNGNGQLGNGNNESTNVEQNIMDNIKSIDMGGYHSSAIDENGDLYVWGSNCYAQLGDGTTTDSSVPIKISLP